MLGRVMLSDTTPPDLLRESGNPAHPPLVAGSRSAAVGRTPFSLTVRASRLVGIFGIIRIRISVSTQKSVPKIVDDGKIAVSMFMMNKMELLLFA